MYDKNKIGIRIKELRIKNDLSQEELGLQLGMNKSTIQRYESGNVKKIKDPIIEKMATIFKVSMDYLLGKTDTPINPNIDGGITFDDFSYAMYDETKELTDEDKDALLNMARILKKKNLGTTDVSKTNKNEVIDITDSTPHKLVAFSGTQNEEVEPPIEEKTT